MGKAMSIVGTVFMGLLDSDKNLAGGLRKVGNCYPFSLQVTTESKTQTSRMRETAGQTLHSKVSLAGTAGSLTLREWDAMNLAWALSGEATEMTETSGTVTGESVTLVSDEWVELAYRDVSSVVISGSVENTDFEVHAALGMIKMLSTGNLSAGATSVDYAYAAESGYKVEIGTKTQIRVRCLIDGVNEYDDEPFVGEFDSMVLASSAEINLISAPDTEYEELPFTATFETLTGKTSPGRINGMAL